MKEIFYGLYYVSVGMYLLGVYIAITYNDTSIMFVALIAMYLFTIAIGVIEKIKSRKGD